MEFPKMTRAELAQVMDQLVENETFLRDAGQKEYARKEENAFANFNRIGETLDLPPEKVLLVYLMKHMDGIAAWVNGHRSQRESVFGRIGDARVYLALLAAMAQWYEDEEEPEKVNKARQDFGPVRVIVLEDETGKPVRPVDEDAVPAEEFDAEGFDLKGLLESVVTKANSSKL